jgi:hypothetical protein
MFFSRLFNKTPKVNKTKLKRDIWASRMKIKSITRRIEGTRCHLNNVIVSRKSNTDEINHIRGVLHDLKVKAFEEIRYRQGLQVKLRKHLEHQ